MKQFLLIRRKITVAITFFAIMSIAVVAYAGSYIANANSGIFHHSYCASAKRMSTGVRVEYEDRDECIEDGYRPCKKCRP